MAGDNYGLTEAGFKLKRLRQILDEVQQSLSQVQDPDSGESLQVDFNEDDPFIQFINICCDQLSAIWEVLNAVCEQFDPTKASGPMLSSLVQLNGIMRKQGTPSELLVTFYGNPGVNIPKGTAVTDADEKVKWETSEAVTIAEEGEVDVLCYSEENGSFAAPIGTVNKLINSIQGVSSVINKINATLGTANESDIALRRRRQKSTETPSQGLAESIYGSISSLEGVIYCKVFTNRTLYVDEKGISPKSIAVVVQVENKEDEELEKEIAHVIFMRSGLGEEYYNLQNIDVPNYCRREVSYVDMFKQITNIRFIYPKEREISIRIVISPLEDSKVLVNYDEQIKKNIVEFARYGVSGLGIETQSPSTFDQYGFPPGEDIVVSRLYTAINAVKGVNVKSLVIGVDGGSLTDQDIPIDWYEVGTFKAENIQIILEDNNGN